MSFLVSVIMAGSCLVPPVDAPVVDPFRPPACEWCPGNRGIEYGPTLGQVVGAAAGGTVTFSGRVAGTLYVVLAHADGTRTTYGGLLATNTAPGAFVALGEPVGLGGLSLHFGLRRGAEYLDPTPLLGRLGRRPRLVPLDGTPPRTVVGPARCIS